MKDKKNYQWLGALYLLFALSLSYQTELSRGIYAIVAAIIGLILLLKNK